MIKSYKNFTLWGKEIFVKAEIVPPFRHIVEMHDEACFYYVIDGGSMVLSPTGRYDMKHSDGVVLHCGKYLNEYFSSVTSDSCIAIAAHLHSDVLKMLYDQEFPEFLISVHNIKPISIDPVKSSALVTSYIENLQFYFDNPELVSDELIKLKLKELILLLAKTDNVTIIKSLLQGIYSSESIEFKEIIEANIYNGLTLDELAGLASMSKSTFKRTFAKHYSDSPAKYIRKKRLKKAAQLLKASSKRISDVAYDVGFKDLAHFSKSFNQEYRTSPSSYRDNQK